MDFSKASPVRRRPVPSIRRSNLSAPNLTQHWNFKEKQAMLKGLKAYGGSDPAKLASVVKTKSVEQCSRFVEFRKRRIAVTSSGTTAPIDLWLNKAHRTLSKQHDFSKGLAEVFSNCVQSGYHDVYQFLIHLCKLETPPVLSDASGSVLLALLDDLAAIIRTLDIEEVREIIKENQNADSSSSALVSNDDNLDRFYNEGPTGTTDKEELDSFNPLKLPPSSLKIVFQSARESMKDLIALSPW